ncbi:MAG: PAS domain S-box protein [Gaiellaceae bacterium]
MNTLLGESADNVELGIFVYDDQGKYVAVNRHAADMLGYPRDELLTHRAGDFTESGIEDEILLRSERREGARVIRRKDGSKTIVAFIVAPTRVATIPFYVGVVWELEAGDPRAKNARS